jgi:hypothetical protein
MALSGRRSFATACPLMTQSGYPQSELDVTEGGPNYSDPIQGTLVERVGFEPTVWLPVQPFSSSKILMPVCAAQCLSVCSSLAFLM